MQWSDEALVLRVGKFREADIWVRFVSRRHGMLTAFAFGGSRSRRRFTGCLDAFNRIRVSVAASRDGRFLNMQEATLLEGPVHIRRDWRRQGVAANCMRFVEAFGVPPDSSSACYDMLAEMLRVIEDASAIPAALPVFFRFKLASEQGYAPELAVCPRCGSPMPGAARTYFLVQEGTACCAGCRAEGESGMMLDRETLDVLRKVKEKSPLEWRAGEFSPEASRQAARAIDAFVRYHVGLEWSDGRFRAM
ncbi:MAG: DNA repair protein RecO [Desulfovibrio sp.]